MGRYISPAGNPEVWDAKPKGYLTHEEWEALHPPVETPDTRTASEKRKSAYLIESDPLFQQYSFYLAESKGLERMGKDDEAKECHDKAMTFLDEYTAKKIEIRNRHSDQG